jgi:hypothetical protein
VFDEINFHEQTHHRIIQFQIAAVVPRGHAGCPPGALAVHDRRADTFDPGSGR